MNMPIQLRVVNDYLWTKTGLLAQTGLCHLNTARVQRIT